MNVSNVSQRRRFKRMPRCNERGAPSVTESGLASSRRCSSSEDVGGTPTLAEYLNLRAASACAAPSARRADSSWHTQSHTCAASLSSIRRLLLQAGPPRAGLGTRERAQRAQRACEHASVRIAAASGRELFHLWTPVVRAYPSGMLSLAIALAAHLLNTGGIEYFSLCLRFIYSIHFRNPWDQRC